MENSGKLSVRLLTTIVLPESKKANIAGQIFNQLCEEDLKFRQECRKAGIDATEIEFTFDHIIEAHNINSNEQNELLSESQKDWVKNKLILEKSEGRQPEMSNMGTYVGIFELKNENQLTKVEFHMVALLWLPLNNGDYNASSIIEETQVEKKECQKCGVKILPSTFTSNNGLCARCIKKTGIDLDENFDDKKIYWITGTFAAIGMVWGLFVHGDILRIVYSIIMFGAAGLLIGLFFGARKNV